MTQSLVSRVKSSLPPLQTIERLARIVGAVGVPVVVAIVGYVIQKEIASESTRKDYVQLAVSILREEKVDSEWREWALKVFEQSSPVALPSNLRAELLLAKYPAFFLGPRINVPSDLTRAPAVCPEGNGIDDEAVKACKDNADRLNRLLTHIQQLNAKRAHFFSGGPFKGEANPRGPDSSTP